MLLLCIVFFKQYTAYEMRISDWSSDVCSSDLIVPKWQQATETWGGLTRLPIKTVLDIGALRGEFATDILAPAFPGATIHCRFEERRVRKECVSTCRSRWTPVK